MESIINPKSGPKSVVFSEKLSPDMFTAAYNKSRPLSYPSKPPIQAPVTLPFSQLSSTKIVLPLVSI